MKTWTVCLLLQLLLAVAFIVPADAQTTLIPTGASWRYLADGVDPGTAWSLAGFDDSSWSNGVAKLGFGGDGETTVIGDATNQLTAFYFRHSFEVTDAASVTNLLGRMVRDDGAVVYLNGVEAYRSNMPTNAINYLTLAASTLGAPEETSFVTNAINPALLVNGTNILAIEVHQAATNSSDIGMEFSLLANTEFVGPALNVAITNPPSNLDLVMGTNITIGATASSAFGITHVDFYVDGQPQGSDATAPYSFPLNNLGVGSYTITAVAEENGGLSATSAPVVINVQLEPDLLTLLPNRTCWKYWDRGDDLGSAWRKPGYDDSAWPFGLAELGYGDGDEATVVGFGSDANNKYITTYFRRSFNVPSVNVFTNLILRLKRDDGAAVYLNGVEVFRDNLPSGPITASTPAFQAVDDGTTYVTAQIDHTLLQPEENFLAVEVHQTNGTSSDISFDLQLLGKATQPDSDGDGLPDSWEMSHPGFDPHDPSDGARDDDGDGISNAQEYLAGTDHENALSSLKLGIELNSSVVLRFTAQAQASYEIEYRDELASGDWAQLLTIEPKPTTQVVEVTDNPPTNTRFYRLVALLAADPICQPPVIVSQSPPQTVATGTTFVLNVNAVGTGPFSYQWRLNGYDLAGATNASLTITNAQRYHGGHWDVIVGGCGCTTCLPIPVLVGGTNLALSDLFASRPSLNDAAFEINSTNSFVSAELGEPENPVRSYGKTVWLEWTAPFTGIVTLDSAGSASAAALAVYTGTSLTNLTLEASVGPSATSGIALLLFNAASNTTYQFQLDKESGAGWSALNLSLAPSLIPVPQFVIPPRSLLAQGGDTVTLSAQTKLDGVVPPSAIEFQWFNESGPILDATNSFLTLTNVGDGDARSYTVKGTYGGMTNSAAPASITVVVTGPSSGSITEPAANFGGQAWCGTTSWAKQRIYLFRLPFPLSPVSTVRPCPSLPSTVDSYFQPATIVSGVLTPWPIPGNSMKLRLHTLNNTASGLNTCILVVQQKSCGLSCPPLSCFDNVSSTNLLSDGTFTFPNCTGDGPYFIKVGLFYTGTAGVNVKMDFFYLP